MGCLTRVRVAANIRLRRCTRSFASKAVSCGKHFLLAALPDDFPSSSLHRSAFLQPPKADLHLCSLCLVLQLPKLLLLDCPLVAATPQAPLVPDTHHLLSAFSHRSDFTPLLQRFPIAGHQPFSLL